MPHSRTPAARGFTLVELTIVVAIVAILAAIALPSYSAYIRRTKVAPALAQLSAYMVRMEQRYQDTGTYKKASSSPNGGAGGTTDSCAVTPPLLSDFVITCAVGTDGQTFTATATGNTNGAVSGYKYSIDQNGNRSTVAHPNGAPSGSCWSMRGKTCDA